MVPKSFCWHGHEIRQYPGYVGSCSVRATRIIHLDGKPHPPANIKLWNADSRVNWEGNTLVVDVTNNNSKALFGRSVQLDQAERKTSRGAVDLRHRCQALQRQGAVHRSRGVHAAPTATIPMSRRTLETDKPDNWHFLIVNIYANDPTKQPYAGIHRDGVHREQWRVRFRRATIPVWQLEAIAASEQVVMHLYEPISLRASLPS